MGRVVRGMRGAFDEFFRVVFVVYLALVRLLMDGSALLLVVAVLATVIAG